MSRLRVYELINDSLREIYVGATLFPAEQIILKFTEIPPAAISHWDFMTHKISPNEVENDFPDSTTESFIARYINSSLPKGWKFITGA